jgi:hypothetical protein
MNGQVALLPVKLGAAGQAFHAPAHLLREAVSQNTLAPGRRLDGRELSGSVRVSPGQSGQSFELLAEIAAKDDGVDFDAGDEVASIQFLSCSTRSLPLHRTQRAARSRRDAGQAEMKELLQGLRQTTTPHNVEHGP